MLVFSLACFLLGGFACVGALAASVPRSLGQRNLTGLSVNDIIVLGQNGRVEVWPKDQYNYLVGLKSSAFILTAATPLNITKLPSNQTSASNTTSYSLSPSDSKSKSKRLDARSCKFATVVVENANQSFLNWVETMTSVVHATRETTSVQISSSYSISNTIGVSISASLTLIENFLSTTDSISYSYSWTTTTNGAYIITVPAGYYGAIGSKPLTTPKTGTVWKGCYGDAVATMYSADSYTSQSYSDLAWITAIICLCIGTADPMLACVGSGLLG